MQIILIFPLFVTAAPKVSSITEDGCLVEWTPLKHIQGQGDLHYRVSLTKLKDNEAKIVSLGNLKLAHVLLYDIFLRYFGMISR